jgi:hypothetical protein
MDALIAVPARIAMSEAGRSYPQLSQKHREQFRRLV